MEHLTDLLTDGVDAVRVAAVDAVGRVAARVGLSTEQLHAALAMLEEPLGGVWARGGAAADGGSGGGGAGGRKGHARGGAGAAVQHGAVLATLQQLGAHNAQHVGAIVDELLRVDRRFEPVEAVADDALYVGCAVAVLSAAGQCDQLVARLPRFLVVLHARFPALIPARFAGLSIPAIINDFRSKFPCLSHHQQGQGVVVDEREHLHDETSASSTSTTTETRTKTEEQEEGKEENKVKELVEQTVEFVDHKGQMLTARQLQQCAVRLCGPAGGSEARGAVERGGSRVRDDVHTACSTPALAAVWHRQRCWR